MSKFSVKKPMTIFVAVVLVCILGFISFTSMTTDLLPRMDLPYVMVLTTSPGASPEKIEQTVTKPLEQALSTTSGVKSVTSSSNENSSMVLLEFTQGTNMDSAVIEMSGNIDIVKANLDDAAGTPTLIKINPDMMPVMVASVDIDGKDITETSKIVSDTILPEFERIDGVRLRRRPDTLGLLGALEAGDLHVLADDVDHLGELGLDGGLAKGAGLECLDIGGVALGDDLGEVGCEAGELGVGADEVGLAGELEQRT